MEQAEKERVAIFGERLRPLDWISKDFRELFDRAIDIGNINIVRVVAHQPFSFAKLSIKHNDHLVYQSFIGYASLIYSKGFELKNSNDKISKFLIDRGWRYIKELTDYQLNVRYDNNELSGEEYKGFAFYIIKTFQDLLKKCFDNADAENFEIVLIKFDKLFNRFKSVYEFNDRNNEFSLGEEVSSMKNRSIFGLCSWILNKYLSSENDPIDNYYLKLKELLPQNLNDITELFIYTHSYDEENRWGWTDWESEGAAEEVAYSIDFTSKLEKLYLMLILDKLSSMTDQKINEVKLPQSQELASLASGNFKLTKLLQSIEEEEKYVKVLSQEAISCVSKLKDLLEVVRLNQEEVEKQLRRDTDISIEKVNTFRNNVWANIEETIGVKNLLSYYGLVNNLYKSGETNHEKQFGINTFFEKAAFLPDDVEPNVYFYQMDDGFDFGRSIVHGEDRSILDEFMNFSTLSKNEKLEDILRSEFNVKDAIMISINSGAYEYIESKYSYDIYIPKWHRNFPVGIYAELNGIVEGIFLCDKHKVPIFEFYTQDFEPSVLLIDKNRIGEMIQYLPTDNGILSSDYKEYLFIKVKELESEYIQTLLDDSPEWLQQKGDNDSKKDYLLEKVIVKVIESFEFIRAENFKCIRLNRFDE